MAYRIDIERMADGSLALRVEGLVDGSAVAAVRSRLESLRAPARVVLRAGTEIDAAALEDLLAVPAAGGFSAEAPYLSRWISETLERNGRAAEALEKHDKPGPAASAARARRGHPRGSTRIALLVAAACFLIAIALVIAGVTPMKSKFNRELAAQGLTTTGAPGPIVTEADLASLPPVVQRYLRFMGVVGRPRVTSFRAEYRARFRPKLDGGWLDGEICQFNSQPDVARLFYMTLKFGRVLPVLGRDTYVGGRGRMLIRPLDLFTVEDAQGREMDIGELVTYLNDAVLFAPSMLLGTAAVSWSAVDEASFDVSLSDHGMTVTGRVFLDERGAPRDFSTTDRFFQRMRTRWTTPIDGYQFVDGRAIPTHGTAVWHFPDRDFAYGDFTFRPGDVVFNPLTLAGGVRSP